MKAAQLERLQDNLTRLRLSIGATTPMKIR